jgi:hypothetical protein
MARKKPKQFALRTSAGGVRPLAEGYGGCIASDQITVKGMPVGYMYRTEPNNEHDSGWVFMAGNETQNYLDNASNFSVFTVNAIANHDPDIVPFLGAPLGSEFERDPDTGAFVQVGPDPTPPPTPPGLHPGFPVIEGRFQMTRHWSVELPGQFNRRIEEDQLVLWRPGFTIWTTVWNNDRNESPEERLAWLKERISDQAFDIQEQRQGELIFFRYRVAEEAEDGRRPAFTAFAIGSAGTVQMGIYFDNEADVAMARAVWLSLREELAS